MTYPPYNYQPFAGAYSPVQSYSQPQCNGYQQPPQMPLQAPQMAQTTGNQCYSCRPVTSREEAVAAQIDFFGPGTIMPDMGHGMIYVKRFNQNTGGADFFDFAIQPPEQSRQPDDAPAFATIQDLDSMRQNIEQLRSEIDQLKRPAGRTVKKNDPNDE